MGALTKYLNAAIEKHGGEFKFTKEYFTNIAIGTYEEIVKNAPAEERKDLESSIETFIAAEVAEAKEAYDAALLNQQRLADIKTAAQG